MRHPNQVLSRTQIGEHVWNFDFYNEFNVIDVYVRLPAAEAGTGRMAAADPHGARRWLSPQHGDR